MTAWRWPWQRLASPPSDIWRLFRQISVGPPFRSPPVQPNPQAATAPKPRLSSAGPVYPFSPHISRLLEFSSASSGSPLVGWCQRSASWLVARLASLTGSAARSNRRLRAMKRHLFVVLEDYDEDSFAIHKLDIGGDGDDEGDLDIHSGISLRRLPEPPAGRIGCRYGDRRMLVRKDMQFTVLGSRIIAIGPSTDLNLTSAGSSIVVYDTRTAALTISDLPGMNRYHSYELVVAARDRLYALEYDGLCRSDDVHIYGGLHCLKSDDDKADRRGGRSSCSRWMWKPLPDTETDSPRFFWGWKNDYTTRVPFDWTRIAAHAGPAHDDPDLDAWVGLDTSCDDPDDDDPCHKDEIHLCACGVPSGGRASRHGQPPPWKKVRVDKLLWEDLDCSHVKMQLLYVGGRSDYCLLEHLRLRVKATAGDGEYEYVLRLTMFRVACGDDGELVLVARRPARTYQLPSGDAARAFFCM
uniref:Uncharacterized protein n=1 Tax=Aegilops tauschii TaxID=37682 RepID=M8AYP5_AEGTA